MLELIAAAAALATAGGPSTPERRCSATEVRALVGGRDVCLRKGAEYNWKWLYRPLRIPVIAAGTPCPATAARGKLTGFGLTFSAFGPGPAYPTLETRSGRAAIGLVWPPDDPTHFGWAGTKVLWAVPRYEGAVLIRGRQLDGANGVGFDLGPSWTRTVLRELRLVGRTSDVRPAATFVPAPGCYAYQVDTLRSSYRIVFEARIAYEPPG